MTDMRANLERLIAGGRDGPQIRLALAARCSADGEQDAALAHAEVAVSLDPDYSAAWKMVGGLRAQLGRAREAVEAYRKGIAIAEKRGDQQAAKEMRVFLKRLLRDQTPTDDS
jgi:tetratricopeptide (TPR) repeat protein